MGTGKKLMLSAIHTDVNETQVINFKVNIECY